MRKVFLSFTLALFSIGAFAQTSVHTGGGSFSTAPTVAAHSEGGGFSVNPYVADHREGGGFKTAPPTFDLVDLNDPSSLYYATTKSAPGGFTSALPSDSKSDLTILALLNASLVVSKDAKTPAFKVLNQGGLSYLESAYKKYGISSKNYTLAKPLLSKSKLTLAEVLSLKKLGFTYGVSGSKVFLIDSNSRYVLPLK